MSRALTSLLVLVVLLAATVAPVAAREPQAGAQVPITPVEGEIIPGEVVVTYRKGFVADASRVRGVSMVQRLGADPAKGDAAAPALVSTGGRPVGEVLTELRADPAVLLAEPNYKVFLADPGTVEAMPVDDPKTPDQYSLDHMRVRDAWNRTSGGSNLIAVLDTGVQANHPDLAGRVVQGRDFVNDDTNAADDEGHGTWVAGIIAANANDGYGVAGISWTDEILPVKVMNRQGTGNTADLLAGIRWSADSGADVINMSVGGFPYSQQMQDAVNYAFGKGAVLVGAAGNNRREEAYYPASFDNVISVSATQRDDEFSHWSSYGSKVDVSAPGSSVLTTNCQASACPHPDWGSHTYISGTSFATPNVSGVVALIRAGYPDMTPAQVVDRLYATVDDLGYKGWDKRYGRGRVNAYRALGGTPAAPGVGAGDAFEGNNAVTANAPRLTLGSTVRPTIYPAGDVDVFTVDVPRAGRLDVRVTGVVDTRAYPWHKSGLPIDPMVELFTQSGVFIKAVDKEWETGTELASLDVSGWARIIIRVSNYYTNGNRASYTITPTYVDNVVPVASVDAPLNGAKGVSRFVDPVVRFSEAVSGVSAATIQLRDLGSNLVVPATVTYDRTARVAILSPLSPIRAERPFRIEVSPLIKDAGGNSASYSAVTFSTNDASFIDTDGTTFEHAIEWLLAEEITLGCSAEAFCPTQAVSRDQMAGFIARAMDLAPTATDFFTDDEASSLEDRVNRMAAANLTRGCAAKRFCPSATVTRAQMASFLARALAPAATPIDFFTDDAGLTHERAINRLAAAGIVSGCAEGAFCPSGSVTREQMAAFLYRAFGDSTP